MFRLPQVLCHGSNFNNCVKNTCRSLYSLSTLGIDGYVGKRETMKQYFANDADNFRGKMRGFVENNMTGMIFTDDLKNMIHLAESTNSDLELVEKMIKTFNKQNKEARFGNYVFGPVVMRFFHHVNNPDVALKLFLDPDCAGFFDQLMTYQILMDMLYEHGRYQDVIDVYQIVRSRQVQGGMYPRHVVLLVFAACYKENTPESFKFSSELWSELNTVGHIPMRRAITYVAALALKQNAPHVALEIVGTARQQHYVTVRNIKVIAFTDLGRADDAIPILKSVLQGNDPTQKHSFTKDAIAHLKEAVNKSGNSELVQSYSKLEKFLAENGHLSDDTLDDLLSTEIHYTNVRTEYGNDRTVLAASYNHNRNERRPNYGYKKPQVHKRPGLDDMY